MSELESDLEHSNLPERALCRAVVGPTVMEVTPGCVSRVRTVLDLVQAPQIFSVYLSPYNGIMPIVLILFG